jgi:hypothetical protein
MPVHQITALAFDYVYAYHNCVNTVSKDPQNPLFNMIQFFVLSLKILISFDVNKWRLRIDTI